MVNPQEVLTSQIQPLGENGPTFLTILESSQCLLSVPEIHPCERRYNPFLSYIIRPDPIFDFNPVLDGTLFLAVCISIPEISPDISNLIGSLGYTIKRSYPVSGRAVLLIIASFSKDTSRNPFLFHDIELLSVAKEIGYFVVQLSPLGVRATLAAGHYESDF